MNNGCVYADKINADKIKKTLKIRSSTNNVNNTNETNAKPSAISLLEFYVLNYPHSSEEVWRQKIEEGKITIGNNINYNYFNI
jgi:hypothetical protein